MAETGATADVNVSSQGAGSGASGEPQGSTNGNGESGDKGTANREPGAEGLFDGMDAPTLHRSYKKLQGEYSRIQNDVVKKFEAFGGADQVLQWTQYLSQNPEFAQWVVQQKQKTVLGIDESQLDEPTKQALEAVRKIARSVVEDEVGKMRKHEIAPLNEAAKQQLLATHFDTMEKEYGSEWNEMRDLMSELSESLPSEVQDHPTFEDVEDLYFKALRKANKLEAYAANKLKKSVDNKRMKATDRPGTGGQNAPGRATSIAEAFRQAKSAGA